MQPRKLKSELKRAAILTAAIELFLKNGFAKTSMDAVAARAKVTKQTVYVYFKNKNSLFVHIINELAQKHAPAPELLKDTGSPVDQRLYDIGLGYLNVVSSKEGIAATQLVIAEAFNHQKLAQHYYESGTRRILEMLGQFLAVENKRDTLKISSPLSAASYFLAMLKGNYYLRILLNIKPRPKAGEKEAHVQECVSIFMRLYGGKNALATKNTL